MATFPSLPDTDRLTTYTGVAASVGPFNVGFHIYADDDDTENWLEVWVNDVQVLTGWTLTSATGFDLSILSRPITDGKITFASAITGTLIIVGARRPRRALQFLNGTAIPANAHNRAYNDIMATLREFFDLKSRMFLVPPGELGGTFDDDFGDGNVLGQLSSVDNSVVRFDGTTGKIIQGSGITISDDALLSFTSLGAQSTTIGFPGFGLIQAIADLGAPGAGPDLELQAGDDIILRVGVGGAGGTLHFLGGIANFDGQLIAQGTATNDSAAAGDIGEFMSATVESGAAVALTNGINANVATITVTPGDWDVTARPHMTGGATTQVANAFASLSETSATILNTAAGASQIWGNNNTLFSAATYVSLPPVTRRISVTANTQLWLVALAAFTVSTCAAFGHIHARRVR